MKSSSVVRTLSMAAALFAMSAPASAQKVVVSHDEWFTGSCCFAGGEQQFIGNALNWFGVTSGMNVLIYSTNGFLNDGAFSSYLASKSISTTTNDVAPSSSFSSYNAIFVSGNPGMDAAGLTAYVMAGGNVFVIGGTGVGGAAAEAGYNNPFLNSFGLAFASTYNGLNTINTSGYAAQGPYGAALFTGVNSVYANNGNSVQFSSPVAGVTDEVWMDGNEGTFGAAQVTATPEPAAIGLLATGLLALVPVVRRKRKE